MSDDFWNDDDSKEEFRDNPVEFQEGQNGAKGQWVEPQPAFVPVRTAPQPQQLANGQDAYAEADYSENEASYAEQADSEEEDYSAVLSDARLRLEQGRLYEMVMKHNLFEGMDADERAVKQVQREIVRFAKERMEIMLGMRQEVQKVDPSIVSSPFNELEVTILKSLAATASNGKTLSAEANNVAQKLNPIGGSTRQQALRPIGQQQVARRLPSQPAAPIKRAERPLVEKIRDEGYKPLDKHPLEMTEQELVERNREAAKRQPIKPKASGALPPPTYEQEEMLHMQKAMSAAPAVQSILNLMNASKR